jgi:O-Antigen ligase
MSGTSIGHAAPRVRGTGGLDAPVFAALVVLASIVGGYLLLHERLMLAVAFCVLPLVIWLLGRPAQALVFLGASIPIAYSVAGGSLALHVAPVDLLLVFIAAGLFFDAVARGTMPSLQALRPVKGPLVQYGVFLLVLLLVHFSLHDVLQTGQRVELFLLPLVVGSFAVLSGRHVAVLKAYVLAATALAALWPFAHVLGQKNPVGQMIADALLLLIGVRRLRGYSICALVLVPGILLTGSRGAVLALGVGILVMFALRESRNRGLFARIAVVVLIAFATFAVLPASLQQRLSTFSAGTNSRPAYALHIRQEYAHDAVRIIKAHPVVGIGVGNYAAGSGQFGTTDPHNVLLLQAAEGGYAFALSFLVLIGVSAFALTRMRSIDLAPVAAGVFLATFAHGLVDIYWVRGTPVLGWLLIGMACGQLAQRATTAPEEADA